MKHRHLTFLSVLFSAIIGAIIAISLARHDDAVTVNHAADLPRLDDACNPGKRTLVVFTAEWCGYCKLLKEKTIGDPAVQARLRDYVVTYVDVEKDRGLSRTAGISALPTAFALSKTCATKGKLEGAYPPEDFLKWLDQTEK